MCLLWLCLVGSAWLCGTPLNALHKIHKFHFLFTHAFHVNAPHVQCNINADVLLAEADAMVTSGMVEAGYRSLNIDDCWPMKQRSPSGEIVPDPNKFPFGMANFSGELAKRGTQSLVARIRPCSQLEGGVVMEACTNPHIKHVLSIRRYHWPMYCALGMWLCAWRGGHAPH